LKIFCPGLFSIADHLQFRNGNIHCFFTRPAYDWEVEVVSSFFELLYSQRVRQEGDGRICWIPSKRKLFEVKSYYCVLSILGNSSFL
jgi:hypothetical protein